MYQLCAHHTFPYSCGRNHPSAGVTVDVTSVVFFYSQQRKCLFSEGFSAACAACDSLKTWRILSAATPGAPQRRILLAATTNADSCKQKQSPGGWDVRTENQKTTLLAQKEGTMQKELENRQQQLCSRRLSAECYNGPFGELWLAENCFKSLLNPLQKHRSEYCATKSTRIFHQQLYDTASSTRGCNISGNHDGQRVQSSAYIFLSAGYYYKIFFSRSLRGKLVSV